MIGDQFCVQCHADLRTEPGRAPQFATHIRGFDDGHPEFSVLVAGQNEPQPKRVKLSDKAALRDPTAIKLNHAVHLTPERMTTRYQAISDAHDPNATVATLETFVIENGRAGAVGA